MVVLGRVLPLFLQTCRQELRHHYNGQRHQTQVRTGTHSTYMEQITNAKNLITYKLLNVNMTRERLIDIIVTALIGAGIAFLQSLLLQMTGHPLPTPSPEIAAVAAGGLKMWASPLRYS
mgnify:CR=1 FL=1